MRAKMSGSSKENVPSKGSHQRPTPEMTTVTPRVTRSSSRRVRFSDDSGVSVVPFTPDLENSASFAVKAEKMGIHDVPAPSLISEDPLEDFNKKEEQRKRNKRNSEIQKGKKEFARLPKIAPMPPKILPREPLAADLKFERKDGITGYHPTPKAVTPIQIVKPMGILVPKSHPTLMNTPDSVKVWTRCTKTPVSAPQYQVTVRPIEVTNTDAVVPGSVKNETINYLNTDASSSKDQSSGEDKVQSSKDQSSIGQSNGNKIQSTIRGVVVSYEHRQQGEMKIAKDSQDGNNFDNIKYYHLKNLSKNLLVRATKFFLNGEVCYLIPAKVVLDHTAQEVEGQSLAPTEHGQTEVAMDSGEVTAKETIPITTETAIIAHLGSNVKNQMTYIKSKTQRSNLPSNSVMRVNNIICHGSQRVSENRDLGLPSKRSKVPVTQMGSEWHDFVPPKSSAATCHPGFQILESRVTEYHEELSFTKNRASRSREQPNFAYPSTRHFKRNSNGLPKIRVSRLMSKGEASKFMNQMSDDAGQTSKDENDNGSNTEDKHEEDRKSSSFRKKRRGKPKTKKHDGLLRYTIHESNNCSFLIADRPGNQDFHVDCPRLVINGVPKPLPEPVSSPVSSDQQVPDLAKQRCDKEKINEQFAKFLAQTEDIKVEESRGKEFEIVSYLFELKSLVGISEETKEVDLIVTATNCILDLESKVRSLMNEFCPEMVSDLLSKVFASVNESSAANCDTSFDSVNDIDPSQQLAFTSHVMPDKQQQQQQQEPEFVVPQICNTPDRKSRLRNITKKEGTLPEVPNLDRLTSPELEISTDGTWSPSNTQAHSDLVLSQGSQRTNLNWSSQVSFSDSLTDDSENIHEFDLCFGGAEGGVKEHPEPTENVKKTFQTYVDELLENFESLINMHEKASPRMPNDQATVPKFLTPEKDNSYPNTNSRTQCLSSPLRGLDYESPVQLTPPKINVACLTSDIPGGNEASPLWYQTIDFESNIYGSQTVNHHVEAVNHPLSMTVIERNDSHVTVLCEGNNRHQGHIDFNNDNNDNNNDNCSRVTIDSGENNGRDNRFSNMTINNVENNRENNGFVRHDCEGIGLMKHVSTVMGFDVNRKPWKKYRWNGNRLEEEDEDPDVKALRVLKNFSQIRSREAVHGKSWHDDGPKSILAKDLINSDLLASFLFPTKVYIPEDPFGIGAETVVSETVVADTVVTKDIEPVTAKENVINHGSWNEGFDGTPPHSKTVIVGLPPKVLKKGKGAKKRAKDKGESYGVTKKKARKLVPENELRPITTMPEETIENTVFIPNIVTEKKRGKIQTRIRTSPRRHRRALKNVNCNTI